MKKSLIITAILSSSLLVGCQSTLEKEQEKLELRKIEIQNEMLDKYEEYIQQQEGVETYKENKITVPEITEESIDWMIKQGYDVEVKEGTYLEICPVCGGNYTCLENSECHGQIENYIH